MNNPLEGFQNSQAYQVSGLPFVYTGTGTGSIEFQNVSKFVAVTAIGSSVSIYFQPGAATARKFVILSGTTVNFDIRIRDLYFETAGTASIMAGLTTIPIQAMPKLTGSIWNGI